MTLKLTNEKDVAALLRGASTKPEITSLSFKRVKFDQNEAAALFTLMKVNRPWTHVAFEDCEGVQLDVPIATFMFNDNVKKMSFLQTFSRSTSVALNAALHFTQCLETVRIEAKLTQENTRALAEALGNNCNFKELNLRSSEIDDESVTLLADGLKGNKHLRSLSIKNCRLSDKNVGALVEALAQKESLQELDLGYNRCSTATLACLTYILEASSCKLAKLSLENQIFENSDDSLDIVRFAGALSTDSDLKYLDLSGNRLDNDDLLQLATALKANTTLEALHLWNNKLTDHGAKSFADIIPSFHGLKRLYLGENQFGKEGCTYVLQALELNDAIQYVALPAFSWVREMAV
jgi:Ran GTPase-activating protein (RanGAP) involved in mRNA processing and transport